MVLVCSRSNKWYHSQVAVFYMAEEKSTIGGVKIELNPFDGRSNFPLWQRKMRNILIQQDLHMCILGVEHKPEEMSTEAWNKADLKAMSSIELHLSDEVTYNVMEETTAKGTWDKLEKLYMGKTLSNKLFLKDQLYNLRMEEGKDIMEHLNVFNRLVMICCEWRTNTRRRTKCCSCYGPYRILLNIFGPHSCLERTLFDLKRLFKT